MQPSCGSLFWRWILNSYFTSKIVFIPLYRWELTERYKQTADEGRVSLIVGKVSLENTDFIAPYKYPKLFNLFQTEDFMKSYDFCVRLGAFQSSLPFFFSKIYNYFYIRRLWKALKSVNCGKPNRELNVRDWRLRLSWSKIIVIKISKDSCELKEQMSARNREALKN